jgi:hypothetical protein
LVLLLIAQHDEIKANLLTHTSLECAQFLCVGPPKGSGGS